jgi:hypothetical protein
MIPLDKERRDAERYVFVSKGTSETLKGVHLGAAQGVTPSQTTVQQTQQTVHPQSPSMKLQYYLKSIGQL